jgi:epoxyqueuosine reductase
MQQWATDLGFAAMGISDANPEQHADHLHHWLAKNRHGEMGYMANGEALRRDPSALHNGTTRVVSLRMNYWQDDTQALEVLEQSDKAYLSRYALGRDYHKLIRARLATMAKKMQAYVDAHLELPCHSRPFVDSAPVLERGFAEKAGLGWIGKNTMLINSTVGSWFFLGELLTNIPLPIDAPQRNKHCGSCTACLDICPTNAFSGPFELDARKCISYLTIELKGEIPVQYRKAIGNRVFGCDDCQLICPWNKFAQATDEKDFKPRHGLDNSALLSLFLWTESEFEQRTRGSAIRRIGYQRWLRNLAVALGNSSGGRDVIDALKAKKDFSELVRIHVEWALTQLENNRMPL